MLFEYSIGKIVFAMKTQQSKNLYKIMQRFADITVSFILNGQLNRAAKCLQIADKLFRSGNIIIKNAIANVFVYSLARVLDKQDKRSHKVLAILPFSLKREYDLQVNSCCI